MEAAQGVPASGLAARYITSVCQESRRCLVFAAVEALRGRGRTVSAIAFRAAAPAIAARGPVSTVRALRYSAMPPRPARHGGAGSLHGRRKIFGHGDRAQAPSDLRACSAEGLLKSSPPVSLAADRELSRKPAGADVARGLLACLPSTWLGMARASGEERLEGRSPRGTTCSSSPRVRFFEGGHRSQARRPFHTTVQSASGQAARPRPSERATCLSRNRSFPPTGVI